jgi:phage-related protein
VQLQAQVTAAEEAERPFAAAAAAAGAAAGGASSAYSPAADKVFAKLEPHHAAVGAQFQLLFSKVDGLAASVNTLKESARAGAGAAQQALAGFRRKLFRRGDQRKRNR